MSVTTLEARDIMFGIFKAVWDPTGYVVVYSDLDGAPPAGELPWVRATIQHAIGGQGSLPGVIGQIRFQSIGTITFQVFAPLGDGGKKGYELAALIRTAFEDSHDCAVWFRNARIVEVGKSGAFFQINVLATFQYDTVH